MGASGSAQRVKIFKVRRKSSGVFKYFWMPAFAGMTKFRNFYESVRFAEKKHEMFGLFAFKLCQRENLIALYFFSTV